MQEITIYQLDAFTGHLFGVKPAAVCSLEGARVLLTGRSVYYMQGKIYLS
ncbi:MAG: hypothetical protein ACKVJG_09310 [Candidatus Latescibacterota bacterium]|jgi:predicted PhzF superfamily epimerase YddE/YHI9|tara:strand:+ start:764 stop:913 length:150 start_codon:yes stop_codon:yes gene_type:complete